MFSALLACIFCGNGYAQLEEGFDDIAVLPSAGWHLINLSQPLGSQTWFQGNTQVFSAQAGAPNSYIAGNFNFTSGLGHINGWIMTPVLTLRNGETWRFWTRGGEAGFADRLYLKLSTDGASTTPSSFSVTLEAINPILNPTGYPSQWTEYTGTLSGLSGTVEGRLAFHYDVTDGGPGGWNSDYIGIDSFFYSGPIGGSNSQPGWYNGHGIPGRSITISSWPDGKSDASIYEDFDVPTGGWVVNSIYFRYDTGGSPVLAHVGSFRWEIRAGVTSGSGGTLIASGESVPTISGGSTGTCRVSGLSVVLPQGKYWVGGTVRINAPFSVAGQLFAQITNGAGAIGSPPGNNANSFFNGTPFWGVPPWTPLIDIIGSPADVSFGVDISGPAQPPALPHGNTYGWPPRPPESPQNRRPIVLVNGLDFQGYTGNPFVGGTNGEEQWETFKTNFIKAYTAQGYSANKIFVCHTLNTNQSLNVNADQLQQYLLSIAPLMGNVDGFHLVGYSKGGLIVRRWENKYDNGTDPANTNYNPLGKKLVNVVTVASPHLGVPFLNGLLFLAPFDPVISELNTPGVAVFNHRNPGLPGTRYTLIGADVDGRVINGTDFIVPTYSSVFDSWAPAGFRGWHSILNGLAHTTIFGVTGVLHSNETVTAVYDALQGGGGMDKRGLSATEVRPAHVEMTILHQGGLIERDIRISADSESMRYEANWEIGGATATLIEPGGRLIDANVALTDPNVERHTSATGERYAIYDPLPGLWKVRLSAGAGIPPEGADASIAVHDDADCEPSTGGTVLTHAGQNGRVLVSLKSGEQTFTSGAVTANLIRPNGAVSSLAFFDDGQHGDGAANDGVFGSAIVTPTASGAHTVVGVVWGNLNVFGQAQRSFTAQFDHSPNTARIQSLAAIRPIDDPVDNDEYYDLLNVDLNIQINLAGGYTLSGDLVDTQGRFIDSVTEIWTAGATGASVKTLSFRGGAIGEHDQNGPYTIRNVRLTHDTTLPVMTDYVETLGTTQAYSKLLFETVHARAVAAPGFLRRGLNLISFPLDPVAPYSLNLPSILGDGVVFEPGAYVRRGAAYFVNFAITPPSVVSYLGTQDGVEFAIDIPVSGRAYVGCPYNRALPLSRVYIRNNSNGQVRTAQEDAGNAAPWIIWTWRYMENGMWKRCMLSGGEDNKIQPWHGYEVTVNVGNLTVFLRD